MTSRGAARLLLAGLVAGLGLAGCTGSDPQPVPTTPATGSGALCHVYDADRLAEVLGADADDLDVRDDFADASFAGPGDDELANANCYVKAPQASLNVVVSSLRPSAEDLEDLRSSVASPGSDGIAFPASAGIGLAWSFQDGDGSGGRSHLVVGSYDVTVELSGADGDRDLARDAYNYTLQTVAAWRLSTDPSVHPSARPS